MGDELVWARGSTVRRGRVRIPIQDLFVRTGEVVAVVGGNGSGKTSLLRAIAGLSAFVGGQSYRERALRVAYVPATLAPLRLRHASMATGFRPRSSEIADALEQLGFDHDPAATRFTELSFGNLRKLLLAEALTSTAQIVCIDEIVEGLDDVGRDGLPRLLQGSANGGAAVVVASVSPHDVAGTDRVIELRSSGRVNEEKLSFVGPSANSEQLRRYAESLGYRER